MSHDFMLMRSGAIVNVRMGWTLYEAEDLAHLAQAQREHLVRLHNENPGLGRGEGLEILRIWEREGFSD